MKKKSELFFPASIYDEVLIDRAIIDYQSICRIHKVHSNDGIVCAFVDSIAPLELTVNEFANYLIELANSRGNI